MNFYPHLSSNVKNDKLSATDSMVCLPQLNVNPDLVKEWNTFPEQLSKQQIKKRSDYYAVLTFYEEANVNQELAKLEVIFNYSTPHYSIFYAWFMANVKTRRDAKIRLKFFVDHFFNYLTFFGYKKTSITKVKAAILFLAPLKLKIKELKKKSLLKKSSKQPLKKNEFRLSRCREGLQFEGLYIPTLDQ